VGGECVWGGVCVGGVFVWRVGGGLVGGRGVVCVGGREAKNNL
jgi:hypothetical protein